MNDEKPIPRLALVTQPGDADQGGDPDEFECFWDLVARKRSGSENERYVR